jgi:hypothetical protein
VGVLPSTLAEALFVLVGAGGQQHQIDAPADVDQVRVDLVVFDRLDRPIGPGLEVLPDVDERVRLDDVPGDARVRFPAVTVQPRRDQIPHLEGRAVGDLPTEVVEAEERRHCEGPVSVGGASAATVGASAADTAGQSGGEEPRSPRERPPAGDSLTRSSSVSHYSDIYPRTVR